MLKVFDEPHESMNAPCRCNCGNWFDLDEGYGSELNKGDLVCYECHLVEVAKTEREEEIEELKSAISEAEYTLKESIERLKQLGVNYKQRYEFKL